MVVVFFVKDDYRSQGASPDTIDMFGSEQSIFGGITRFDVELR